MLVDQLSLHALCETRRCLHRLLKDLGFGPGLKLAYAGLNPVNPSIQHYMGVDTNNSIYARLSQPRLCVLVFDFHLAHYLAPSQYVLWAFS